MPLLRHLCLKWQWKKPFFLFSFMRIFPNNHHYIKYKFIIKEKIIKISQKLLIAKRKHNIIALLLIQSCGKRKKFLIFEILENRGKLI